MIVISASTVSCDVKAFVEATPISGPACTYTPPSDSRAMLLPTTFTIPSTVAPLAFASRSADSVSAVSPLWLIRKTTSSMFTIGSRYRNSDAYSTSVGMRAICSNMYSPTSAACHDVPQAVRMSRRALSSRPMMFCRPPSFTSPSSTSNRPRMALRIVSGCSWISFSMK